MFVHQLQTKRDAKDHVMIMPHDANLLAVTYNYVNCINILIQF